MKKNLLLVFALCLFIGFDVNAQGVDVKINPLVAEQFGQTYADSLQQANPAELFKLNFKVSFLTKVVPQRKLGQGDHWQVLSGQYLEDFAIDPVAYGGENGQLVSGQEDIIVEEGYINPFIYNLPQDENKYQVIPLHHEGYYVLVRPQREYNAVLHANMQKLGLE